MSNPSSASSAPARRSRRPRRRLLLALAVVLLTVVGAACEQMHPDNRAAPVPGVTNGALPLSYLASTGKGCVVFDEAIESLRQMIAQAAKDGVSLRPASCYRDYAGQVAARQSWCDRGACHMAAVPGTSNHGWGKAIDFSDQTGSLDWDSPGYIWLKTWGWHFGWMHPTVMEPDGPVPEPWHFEWIGDGGKMFPGKYFGVFGNTPPAIAKGQPFGSLDSVVASPGKVQLNGWAIDPDVVTPIPVHIYVDGHIVQVLADQYRPDVQMAFPLYAEHQHGYGFSFGTTPGRHDVCVYAINVAGTGTNPLLGCRTVDVPAPTVSTPSAVTARSTAPSSPAPSTTAPSTTSTTQPPAATTTTTVPAPPTVSSTTTSTPAQGS
jgi:hypothetical protein